MAILVGKPGLTSFPLDFPSSHILLHHPTMSFSDRRDSGEGRRVEGKYMLWGVIGAEV